MCGAGFHFDQAILLSAHYCQKAQRDLRHIHRKLPAILHKHSASTFYCRHIAFYHHHGVAGTAIMRSFRHDACQPPQLSLPPYHGRYSFSLAQILACLPRSTMMPFSCHIGSALYSIILVVCWSSSHLRWFRMGTPPQGQRQQCRQIPNHHPGALRR